LKITMLTESLGSGGAERQICTLAVEMKRRGHDVQVVTYAPGDFFLPMLLQNGVEHTLLGGNGRWQWLPRIRSFLRRNRQDVVVAFLGSCASYAEIASLPLRSWGLVVSERTAFPGMFKGSGYLRKSLHLLADAVITNSHTNRLMLEKSIPWLKGKLITIYNAIDHNNFRYVETAPNKDSIRIVVASRISREKNILGLIKAVALLKDHYNGDNISVNIYGNSGEDSNYLQECLGAIEDLKLHNYIRLNRVHNNIAAIYQEADVVLLTSFFEGLPNAICESMACGKPILMSEVSDARNLVIPGQNGFLFNPHYSESIAEAILRFASLPQSARREMGLRSNVMAKRLFDLQLISDRFETVLFHAAQRQSVPVDHWPPELPETAFYFKGVN
jgi:glycosyltransferase involved in cell wall biosynthesis